MTFDRPFDAVLGRYVLQHQPDPATMLRQLAGHLRPGGLIVFQEIDWSGVASVPPVPTYELCRDRVMETLRLSGSERHMGTRLYSAFLGAGLPVPTMRLEALIGGGPNSLDRLTHMAELVTTLLPEMERLVVRLPRSAPTRSSSG